MRFILLITALCLTTACSHSRRSRDLTEQNVFTSAIEGPAFDAAGNLYVVNFQQLGTIGKVDIKTGRVELWLRLPTPSIGNSIRFNNKGEMFVADYVGHNVLKIDPRTKKISVFVHDKRFNQPNDMALTHDGYIFLSDPDFKNGTGKLWRVSPSGKAMVLENKMGTTNGIEVCPDGKTLYLNESNLRNIWRYEIAANRSLKNKTLFATFDKGDLDGMKCDEAGNLYVTRYGVGIVAKLNSLGRVIEEIKTIGTSPSNIVLSHKNAYVTLQDRGCIETFGL